MPKITKQLLRDNLDIVWAMTSKDIVDALRNRTVVSMIILLTVMLLLPKLPSLIFEHPQITLPVYDKGDSNAVENLANMPDMTVQQLQSEQEFNIALCSALYPEIGLMIPKDFDQFVKSGERIEFEGYVCWGKRHQISVLKSKLEQSLSQSLERPVTIQLEGNLVYPPASGGGILIMTTINAVILIQMMGIFLVPSLLLDEKETKTMEALLVSPASIGQVVMGKALAGLFYILVTALMMFAISWVEVVHWGVVLLYIISGGFFSIAVGLIFGSYFEKQQDMVGWMTAVQLLLVGAIFVKMLGLKVPMLVSRLLTWVPSVALAEICTSAFSEPVIWARVLSNLGIIVAVSLPLYAVVIYKVGQSDR